MPHRLDPLLKPASIAIIGASGRAGTVGYLTLHNLLASGYTGDLYPVNPGYGLVQGVACYATVAALPATPDLAIFCVADIRLEAALDDVIAKGVPAVSIMSSLVMDDDRTPCLKERVQAKIRQAGIVACGANGMGFYSVDERLSACGFDARNHQPPGRATLISHSGSGMCSITDCEERIRFNLVVSTGNELDATMDEYIDYALDLESTRVIGLFVETARNPAGMRAALAKANRKRIPVLAVKVGRTEKSAALTVSHSGAIAGDDATYDALFDYYGVQRFQDLDELATALILFSEWELPGDGGLVALHDSGGERQLMVDLADAHGVPLPELGDDTVKSLRDILEPELPAVNPLDGWSRGGPDAAEHMAHYLSLMMQDEGAAAGVCVLARAPGSAIYPEYIKYMRRAHDASGKPVALVAARQGTGHDPQVIEATRSGLPILDGTSTFLKVLHAMFAWRDFLNTPQGPAPEVPVAAAEAWRTQLSDGALGEAGSLAMLADFGIAVNRSIPADSENAALEAAADLGYPVVLKTAAAGIAHKTDAGGVVLDIGDDDELSDAYRQMSGALGKSVLVSRMLGAGVEMLLGCKRDPQFGPVVIFGIGGIHAEILQDVAFALPPFGTAKARRMLQGLRMHALLDGARGSKPVALEPLCEMVARFSAMVYALKDEIAEIDINPVIAGDRDATAVDALVVGRSKQQEQSNDD